MMATMKHREPRGREANTDYYGFYVRVNGETRHMLNEAQRRVSKHFTAPPSNQLFLNTILESYLRHEEEQ
jgi:hypothetical protein